MNLDAAYQKLDALDLSHASSVINSSWQAPREITSSLPDAPRFEPHCLLLGVLGEFVMDQADLIRCPPDYIAATLMVTLGSVIGARCAVKPKRRTDWIITPNLYGAIVGEPSSRKTPASDTIVKILRGLEAREAQQQEAAIRDYEAEMAAFEARRNAVNSLMKKAATGKGNREEMDKAIADLKTLVEPQPPQQRRFIVNDSTVAKLGDILVHNPQGLLVFCDEITGLIASWDKEGNEADRAFYLMAHNGTGSYTIDRVSRGSLFIDNLCLSLMGGIQPELLERYLTEMANSLDNNGRFQRFQMLVYPEAVQWQWVDRYPVKGTREYVRDLLETLAYFNPVEQEANPANDFIKLPYFHFDDVAIEIFRDWSTALHQNIAQEDNPLMKQHYGKYEKLFCALTLILHLAAENKGDIGEDCAMMAAAWCEYLAGHARRVYGLLETARVKTAQTLCRHLRKGKLPDHFTARDVLRKGWAGLSSNMEDEKALDMLESFGWVTSYQTDHEGAGRPTTRYAINPLITRGQS